MSNAAAVAIATALNRTQPVAGCGWHLLLLHEELVIFYWFLFTGEKGIQHVKTECWHAGGDDLTIAWCK